jgi:hypothetical protein
MQDGQVVRAYFTQNIHGDVALGRVLAAQKGEQALYGPGAADFPQGVFGCFLYSYIRTGDALAQQVEAVGKPEVACRERRAPDEVCIVALQILKNVLGVLVRCAISIHMQLCYLVLY